MATNRLESSKTEPDATHNGAAAVAASAPTAAAGGLKAWLPLVANLVLMPALAYATAIFLLLPKLNSAAKPAGAGGESAAHNGGNKAGENTARKETAGKGSSAKILAPLSGKVLVNVAGTMGTRYLLANVTLVGHGEGFKSLIEKNDAQLRDVAASALSSKTIADLEKPGARNLIRTELISVFNEILGESAVIEIYLTEFAIQ